MSDQAVVAHNFMRAIANVVGYFFGKKHGERVFLKTNPLPGAGKRRQKARRSKALAIDYQVIFCLPDRRKYLKQASVFVFFLAKHKYNQSITSSDAIITSSAVTVLGAPNEKGTKLFLLHEGTKVNLIQTDDDWAEIKIANGNVGWVLSKTIAPI